MKRILFCLALLAAFTLSACGTQPTAPEDAAVPMDGNEAPQYDPSNPLANHLDRSNLTDETVSNATQNLNLEAEDSGVSAKLQQAMGGPNLLYLSLKVTYPDTVEHLGLMYHAPVFTLNGVGQATEDNSIAGIGSSWGCDPDSTTITYLLTAESPQALLTPGQEVTLRMEEAATGADLSFSWTITNQTPCQTISLQDAAGNAVGSAVLSPFALSASFEPTGEDILDLMCGLVLLDRNGNQLIPNESAENSRTERQELFFIFYSPVMVDQVSQVKIGTLSGTVS